MAIGGILAIIAIIAVSIAFVMRRGTQRPPGPEVAEEAIPTAATSVVSEPVDVESTIREMSARQPISPALSGEQIDEMKRSMSASKESVPVLPDAELQQLLESMSAQ